MAVTEAISRYRWVVLALACLAQFGNALAAQVTAPLAPLFQPELGLTKTEVGLFSSAAFAGSWFVLLVAGSFTDRFGVRAVMAGGLVCGGLIMMLMGTVQSFVQAVAIMFAVGLGRGSVLPSSTKAISEWFPASSRATAMGVEKSGVPLGGIVMASTVPALGLALGWRAAVVATGFLVVATGAVIALFYRDPHRAGQPRPAPVGIRTGLAAVIRNRHVWLLSAVTVLMVTAQQATVAYLALYFAEVVLVQAVPAEHARIVAAGGYLALLQVGGVVGRVGWGAVSDRMFRGRRMIVLAMVGLIGAAVAAVEATLAPGLPLWALGVVVFACGATTVGWNGLYHAVIAEAAGRKYAATGMGLSMTVTQAGTVGGPPLFGFVVDLYGSYQVAWLMVAGLSAGSAAMAALASREEGRVE